MSDRVRAGRGRGRGDNRKNQRQDVQQLGKSYL
jgi:hypothetical protein